MPPSRVTPSRAPHLSIVPPYHLMQNDKTPPLCALSSKPQFQNSSDGGEWTPQGNKQIESYHGLPPGQLGLVGKSGEPARIEGAPFSR
jgi:hypothetical protein